MPKLVQLGRSHLFSLHDVPAGAVSTPSSAARNRVSVCLGPRRRVLGSLSSSIHAGAWRGHLCMGVGGSVPAGAARFVWRGRGLLVHFLIPWILGQSCGIIEVPPGLHYPKWPLGPMAPAVVRVRGCPLWLRGRGWGCSLPIVPGAGGRGRRAASAPLRGLGSLVRPARSRPQGLRNPSGDSCPKHPLGPTHRSPCPILLFP